MSKKSGIVISIVAVIALCLSVVNLSIVLRPAGQENEERDVQYVMYLGTNDKDTDEPVFGPEEAQARAEEVHAAADDMISAFHQSSVLIQTNETITEFYGGSN